MDEPKKHPRLVIAGTSGDCGKTLLSLGLILVLRDRGLAVRAFKKGPDYVDAAWLSWAASGPARNLDSFLMGMQESVSSFRKSALAAGVNIVEGNRGLYDGSDSAGTHSTAELAKSLSAPVLLVVNAAKATRTAAAVVLGCQKLDPGVAIAGVILNLVGGNRHERILREAIERECSLPVLGALPRAGDAVLLPSRHLGLVMPEELSRIDELRNNLRNFVRSNVEIERISDTAFAAGTLPGSASEPLPLPDSRGLRIGILRDSALSFYYPENLEALERSGAEIVSISPLTAIDLPPGLSAIYLGGGFPETHASALAANQALLVALGRAAGAGMPMYAECGGLMLLARAIRWQGARHAMAGVLTFEVEMLGSPQGHGYVEMVVDRPNPFYREGLAIRGHEFHYSRIAGDGGPGVTVCSVSRGTGCGGGRDGVLVGNVWASYTHVHALGTPEWAPGLLLAARRYSDRRS